MYRPSLLVQPRYVSLLLRYTLVGMLEILPSWDGSIQRMGMERAESIQLHETEGPAGYAVNVQVASRTGVRHDYYRARTRLQLSLSEGRVVGELQRHLPLWTVTSPRRRSPRALYHRGRSQACPDSDSDTRAPGRVACEGLSGNRGCDLLGQAKALKVSTVPSLLGTFTLTRQSTMSNTWNMLYLRFRCPCAMAAR